MNIRHQCKPSHDWLIQPTPEHREALARIWRANRRIGDPFYARSVAFVCDWCHGKEPVKQEQKQFTQG